MAERVLVVDDERNIRLTLSMVLEGMGLAVETAVTGEEALEKLEQRAPNLVLLDLRMPGIDGMEVLRRLAGRRPDVKVIVITAHGTVASSVEALKLGAVDFLQKPFTPEEIRTVCTEVLRRNHLDERTNDYRELLSLAKRAASEQAFEAAKEHLKRAIAREPNRPEAFNLLGMILEVQGQKREALTNYRAALDFDGTYEPARQNLQRATALRRGGPDLGLGAA
jgi:DNA-binding NtrC family response regulator